MSTPPEPEQGEQGPAGIQGDPGPSAYEVWLEANPGGTLAEFWDFLKGEPGDVGPVGPTGDPGDDGLTGTPGLSVFDLWLEDNPGGTREEFFESLRGPAGPAGPRSLAEVRTVNSDVRRIYLSTTTPSDGVQPGDFQIADSTAAAARLVRVSNQSLASGSFVATVGWGFEQNVGGFSYANGNLTFPTAGTYLIACRVQFEPNGSGIRDLQVGWGAQAIPLMRVGAATSGTATILSGSCVVWGSGVSSVVTVRQNSGSTLQLEGGSIEVVRVA